MSEMQQTRVISGFRPTSDLTMGNYLGGIDPSLRLQADPTTDLYVFVADLHGLTDNDPRDIGPHRTGVVRDCLALGVNPEQTTLFMQSDIEPQVTQIANRLAPYIGVGRLIRTPNLKEKMQQAVGKGKAEDENASSANFALLGYPVLMAADIFAQEAPFVAVGEDQEPHLEIARDLSDTFNNRFGEGILVRPRILAVEGVRVAALNGTGKMSKSVPTQAIMFTDAPAVARKKINRAATASPGDWNATLDSHFTVAELTAGDPLQKARLAALREEHMAGGKVMGEFKQLWGDITEKILVDFQDRRAQITDDDVHDILKEGANKATANADKVLHDMKEKMSL